MKKKISFLLFAVLALSCTFFITCTKEGSKTPVFPVDCAHKLANTYIASDYCTSSSQPAYSSVLTAIDSTNVNISRLSGVPLTAILDCGTNTITIPTQTFSGNFSLSGTGTYTANRIIINWSGLSLGVPINCSTTFTR